MVINALLNPPNALAHDDGIVLHSGVLDIVIDSYIHSSHTQVFRLCCQMGVKKFILSR